MDSEVVAYHYMEGHDDSIYVTLFFDGPGRYRVVSSGDTGDHTTTHTTVTAAGRDYGERVMYLFFRHHNHGAPAVTWLEKNMYN